MEAPCENCDQNRRHFLKEAGAIAISGVAVAVPAAAGLAVFLDPLRRRSGPSELVRVASLESLPKDGSPKQFSIVADRTDAWNRYASVPVGAVYLRRAGDKVEALNVVCPHAGCFVNYLSDRKQFLCPCHNSLFALDGSLANLKSPSARAMDALEVELRNGTEIWVRFQNFQTGKPEKIPAA